MSATLRAPVESFEDATFMTTHNAGRHDIGCRWNRAGVFDAEREPCTCGLVDDLREIWDAARAERDRDAVAGGCYECSLYVGSDETPPPHDHPDGALIATPTEQLRDDGGLRAALAADPGEAFARLTSAADWVNHGDYHAAAMDLRFLRAALTDGAPDS